MKALKCNRASRFLVFWRFFFALGFFFLDDSRRKDLRHQSPLKSEILAIIVTVGLL